MLNELETEVVTGREILDSRRNPTVEVGVCLADGVTERAAVPPGASTGKFKAVELRDGGERYNGQGVKKVVGHMNSVPSEVVLFESALGQKRLDQMLLDADGTESKGELGTGAIPGVSMAIARAAANGPHVPLYRYLGGIHVSQLPIPMMNILNGGEHVDNTVDLREFMIMPYGACCFPERLRMCTGVYHTLKELLEEDSYSAGAGDGGKFIPDLENSEEVLEYLVKAMEKNGLRSGTDVRIATDVAFSELYDEVSGMYLFPGKSRVTDRQIRRSANEMVKYYRGLVERFPICPIEGGLEEEDWEGWKMLTKELGNCTQLVGDNLSVTNTKRLAKGIEVEAGDVTPVKANQIDTLTESPETIEVTKRVGFGTIISRRSGETEDSIIADIAVVVNAGQIKAGTPYRSGRVIKYSQLPHIEENLTLEAWPVRVSVNDLLPALHRLDQCTQPVCLTNLCTADKRSSRRFKCKKGSTR